MPVLSPVRVTTWLHTCYAHFSVPGQRTCCRIGSAKAAVLPLPVSADASMSRPSSAGPMQFHWMSVGRFSPTCSHDFTNLQDAACQDRTISCEG
eukprot:143727-Rhodomonas_salina.4